MPGTWWALSSRPRNIFSGRQLNTLLEATATPLVVLPLQLMGTWREELGAGQSGDPCAESDDLKSYHLSSTDPRWAGPTWLNPFHPHLPPGRQAPAPLPSSLVKRQAAQSGSVTCPSSAKTRCHHTQSSDNRGFYVLGTHWLFWGMVIQVADCTKEPGRLLKTQALCGQLSPLCQGWARFLI